MHADQGCQLGNIGTFWTYSDPAKEHRYVLYLHDSNKRRSFRLWSILTVLYFFGLGIYVAFVYMGHHKYFGPSFWTELVNFLLIQIWYVAAGSSHLPRFRVATVLIAVIASLSALCTRIVSSYILQAKGHNVSLEYVDDSQFILTWVLLNLAIHGLFVFRSRWTWLLPTVQVALYMLAKWTR